MKKLASFLFALLTIVSFNSFPVAVANDVIKQAILELFPQADRDGDGVLSPSEEAAVNRQALKRHPQADRDGDGVLSDAEKMALLKTAAKRMGRSLPSAPPAKTSKPATPSFSNVKYGEHERQVFDIWLADTTESSPLAIFIHGGGFKSGSKEKLRPETRDQLLDAGISVAAINYRYVTEAPLPTAHHDARRALQLMRSKASEWNIDKDRVAAFGGSAGAQICMWLAYTDDMADAKSSDPIARESTRITCVATAGGQTSNQHEFYRAQIEPLLGGGRKIDSLALPLNGESDPAKIRMAMWGAESLEEASKRAESCSALSIVSAGDPPIFMSYGMSPTDKRPSDPKKVRGWLIHHVNFGIALKEKTDALQLESHLKYPGSECDYESLVDFFKVKLQEK